MTCIVALKTEDEIVIGGDHAVNDGDRIHTMPQPKVFKRGQFLIGYCGSLRVGQVVQYGLKIPPGFKKKDLHKYMVVDFCNALRACLNHAGAARKDKEEEEHENRFLVVIQNRIFEIDEGYSVCEIIDGVYAIGSGVEFALGSLYTSRNDWFSPKERVRMALESAAYYCQSVSDPFTIIRVKMKKGHKSGQGKKERVEGQDSGEAEGSAEERVEISEEQAEGDVQEDQ